MYRYNVNVYSYNKFQVNWYLFTCEKNQEDTFQQWQLPILLKLSREMVPDNHA